jgi:tRNA1(Val) A37 N6-methylase TrmN6
LYIRSIINRYEHNILYDYIISNPPFFRGLILRLIAPHKDFYYWRADNIAPRIKWLKKHIKKQSK